MSNNDKSFADVIREQIRDGLKKWRPSDVEKFNGSSWMNLISLVIGDGSLDCDAKIEVLPDDRVVAARFLRKALEAAAVRRRGGVVERVREMIGAEMPDAVAFYKARLLKLPAKVPSKPRGFYNGVRVMEAQPDPAHLERHEVLAAFVLEAFEENPNWKPTQDEILAWVEKVGIR
jgi:hypothetical protein